MKVFNSKLAAIGLAAFVFASCSDSSSDPATPITSGTVPSEITKIGLTQTDAAQLAASVTNYKRSSSNKARTRVIDEDLFNGVTESTVPKAPSVDGAKQLNAATNLSNDKYSSRYHTEFLHGIKNRYSPYDSISSNERGGFSSQLRCKFMTLILISSILH